MHQVLPFVISCHPIQSVQVFSLIYDGSHLVYCHCHCLLLRKKMRFPRVFYAPIYPLIHIETEKIPSIRKPIALLLHESEKAVSYPVMSGAFLPIPAYEIPLLAVPFPTTCAASPAAAASVLHRLHMHQPPRLPRAHSLRSCTAILMSQ
jgi:hypothetical protein